MARVTVNTAGQVVHDLLTDGTPQIIDQGPIITGPETEIIASTYNWFDYAKKYWYIVIPVIYFIYKKLK